MDDFEASKSRSPKESLLYVCRNGDVEAVKNLIQDSNDGKITLDVNCRGESKSNLGWTPIHLSSYFGHREVLQILLDNGADINLVNDAGDTALHKASFIDREDLVLLLLERNADINIRNGEGKRAKDVGLQGGDAFKLLSAAEKTEIRRREQALLSAARHGQIEVISDMLKSDRPPNINCVDVQGNSCLHCASYRGHKEVAVLLLQNGIDTTIKNCAGQTALDLAKDSQMEQVLGVRPVRELQKTVPRFEGPLLKRSRFLGWKPIWAVLERGVLTYFNNRADASSGVKRRDFKYMDGARAVATDLAASTFSISFSDGSVHKLGAPISHEDMTGELCRQKWLNILNDHISFSTHYLSQGPASR